MFSAKPHFDADKLLEWNSAFELGLHQKKVPKGNHFLREGERCNFLYFIQSGFVRVYYHDLNGKEITHWFCAADSIITSPFSFLKGEPNILFFEALENSELILISSDQLEEITEKVPQVARALRQINAEFAMVLSRRIMSIHTETAEERYLNLMQEHPHLFQKSKLAHIASYLGITQQSLSRIRKNL